MDKEAIKKDPSIVAKLKQMERKAFDEEDLITLYDLLDTYLVLDIETQRIDRLYHKILEMAFDALAQKYSMKEIFDLKSQRDLYTVRAIYEHALQRWDSGNFKDARELFGVLVSMIDDESIRKSLLLSLGLCAQRKSLDHFLQNFVDRAGLDEESFFFNALLPQADNYLMQNSDLIERELKKIGKFDQ